MWSLHNKGLCPAWEVQSAAVSDDQPVWKVPKRLFHPCFWLPEWREGDAQQDPPFSRVLDILRKGPCTIVAVMAETVEGWFHYLPQRHKACRCVMGAGREPFVFLLHRRVDTRELTFSKLYLSHPTIQQCASADQTTIIQKTCMTLPYVHSVYGKGNICDYLLEKWIGNNFGTSPVTFTFPIP